MNIFPEISPGVIKEDDIDYEQIKGASGVALSRRASPVALEVRASGECRFLSISAGDKVRSKVMM
jgi:hypothetical protein